MRKCDRNLLANRKFCLDIVDRVSKALLRGEFYEQAGELFEKVDQEDQVTKYQQNYNIT